MTLMEMANLGVAPNILFPASSPLQSPSPSSQLQPLAPANCQTIFVKPTSYKTLPAPASCQSPLPYPNNQPITFSAEDFQFPLQSLPVASACTPRSAANFSPEVVTDSRDSARQLLKGKCKTKIIIRFHLQYI
ncbi:uncharacterized protein LOC116056851 [Sander lucioperca]|uniref:uncharacterized protein LOC116056851 n=1 Tax=Sander lucioperca TaxID=283035 RepID=UPI001653ABEC|nr:uncharacterized protein LOC116056851 [Sander lucioperca]